MASSGSFTRCMSDLRAGDSLAEVAVFERFVNRLIGLAKVKLQPQVQSKMDPEDLVQSAFGSFFDGNAAGKFYFENWDSLWALLARITVRKYNKRMDRLHASKRSVERETPMGQLGFSAIADREPTPEEAALCSDLLESILGSSSKPLHREIILLKLQNHTNAEIGKILGRTERTVYRVLNRTRQQLQEMDERVD